MLSMRYRWVGTSSRGLVRFISKLKKLHKPKTERKAVIM